MRTDAFCVVDSTNSRIDSARARTTRLADLHVNRSFAWDRFSLFEIGINEPVLF